jgi:adiponectin receptor
MGEVSTQIKSFINNNVPELPELHLSSLVDSSEMLHDITRIPLYLHLFSGVLCMGISAIFHSFYCHSSKCNRVLCRCDYAGISLLIGGSNLSPNFYGWYCKEYSTMKWVCLIIIEGSCLIAFFISLHPNFYKPHLRKWRAFMYIFIGVGGAFPALYYALFRDPNYIPEFAIDVWILGGIIYVGGACIYAARFPERYIKGWSRVWGFSHNIWHFCVLTAALFHFFGSLDIYH